MMVGSMGNEAFGWIWIVTGFVSGAFMGLNFQRQEWLGGYDTLRRRLIRLGHIAFFGLGVLNILFACTAPRLHLPDLQLRSASWALLLGGITMPICCGLMAWKRQLQPLFAVPVGALLWGGALMVKGLLSQ